mmetsp:Transcript_29538/g.59609  ORF Transcript_29538/g.59609 Transcript_29538/m.59609 type:complete len:229 (+) Transcript_29538:3-689(+)
MAEASVQQRRNAFRMNKSVSLREVLSASEKPSPFNSMREKRQQTSSAMTSENTKKVRRSSCFACVSLDLIGPEDALHSAAFQLLRTGHDGGRARKEKPEPKAAPKLMSVYYWGNQETEATSLGATTQVLQTYSEADASTTTRSSRRRQYEDTDLALECVCEDCVVGAAGSPLNLSHRRYSAVEKAPDTNDPVVKQFMMSRHSYNFHVGLSNCMEMRAGDAGALVDEQA